MRDFFTWGRKRPGLDTDIPVPVLQGPAGEEGWPSGLPNLLKEEEKEEDEEEKEEDGNDKEAIEGSRRNEEDMQDSLVLEEGIIGKFPLSLLPLVSFPCSSCFQVLSTKKKLNNHNIV